MKDKNIAAILAFFLGNLGGHKFYLGQFGAGVLYLMFSWTFIPWAISFIEFIMLALMDQAEFDRRFNGRNVVTGNHPVVMNMLPPPGYVPPGYVYGMPPHGYGMPAQPGQPTSRGHNSVPDLVSQLEKLNELRIAGLLTEDEFNRQKTKLLDSM